jgi:hypothetical protein
MRHAHAYHQFIPAIGIGAETIIKLAINEDGAAKTLASGGEIVGRNETIDDAFRSLPRPV